MAGLVLDGGVRDVAALEAHGFPVFSATIALTGASKDKPGTVGSPCGSGGIEVAPGDWVVADVDGVAFVPGAAVDDVLAAGRAREAKEAGFFEALRAGSTTVELLGLDASLVRQGDVRGAVHCGLRVAQCMHERRGSESGREGGAHGGGANDPG